MEYKLNFEAMQESDLYEHWLYYARKGHTIKLEERVLRIIHPGRLSLQRGPDFRSARFELDGVTYQGDVEFHLRAGDWYAHRHHLDNAYANVLLHLVGIPEAGLRTAVENRYSTHPIPTFVLPRPETRFRMVPASRSCRAGKRFHHGLKKRLEALAGQRFERKVHRFMHSLRSFNPLHVLYHNSLRAMGYGGNETAFENLSHGVPPHLAEMYRSEPLQLYALYAGFAGFFENENPDHFTRLLSRYYQSLRDETGLQPMQPDEWQLSGVRAANHPHFRLAGWVQLVSRSGMAGFYTALDNGIRERRSYEHLLPYLLNLFDIPVSGYWKNHTALGKRGSVYRKDFLGKARIFEILVNIIIPFFAASARINGSEGHLTYLREFYLWLPLDHLYHSVAINFPWLPVCQKVFPSQGLKQAILHLDATYCRMDRCDECPLKRVPPPR